MATMKFDIAKLTDERKPGRLYKLAPTSVGLEHETAVAVDEGQMAATAIISTPTPDRVRDVLVPRGCRLENYRKNPVVLWEHGFDFSLPIARAEDVAGKLAIAIGESSIAATSYFTHRLKESEQIFALIAERIIRATSVRATPLASRFVASETGDVLVVDQWDLEEWSWVAVPCNPEAVAGVVAKNRLAGSPISEPILKSLKLWLPQSKVQGRGAALHTEQPQQAVSERQWEAAEDVENAAVAPEAKAKRTNLTVEPRANSAGSLTVPMNLKQPTSDLGAPQTDAVKFEVAQGALADLLDQVPGVLYPVEDIKVSRWLDPFVRSMQEVLALLEGLLLRFADQEPGPQSESEAGRVSAGEESGKLASSMEVRAQLQLKGWRSRLKALAAAENLTGSQRATVEGIVRQLAAPSLKIVDLQKVRSEPEQHVRQELDALRATFEHIEQSIREARPYRAGT